MPSQCNFFTKSPKIMCNSTFLYKFDPRNSFLTSFFRLKVKVIIKYNIQGHLSFIQFNPVMKRSLIPKIACMIFIKTFKVMCDRTFQEFNLTVLLLLKVKGITKYSVQGHISFIQFYPSTERSLIPKIAGNILSNVICDNTFLQKFDPMNSFLNE